MLCQFVDVARCQFSSFSEHINELEYTYTLYFELFFLVDIPVAFIMAMVDRHVLRNSDSDVGSSTIMLRICNIRASIHVHMHQRDTEELLELEVE